MKEQFNIKVEPCKYFLRYTNDIEYNKYYEIATAEFHGGPRNLIKYTINLITDKMSTRTHSEHVYYNV